MVTVTVTTVVMTNTDDNSYSGNNIDSDNVHINDGSENSNL